MEEVDLWGYPVLLFHMFLVLWNLRDTIATSSSGISPSMPDQDEKLQEMKAEATVAACGQTDNNYNHDHYNNILYILIILLVIIIITGIIIIIVSIIIIIITVWLITHNAMIHC